MVTFLLVIIPAAVIMLCAFMLYTINSDDCFDVGDELEDFYKEDKKENYEEDK